MVMKWRIIRRHKKSRGWVNTNLGFILSVGIVHQISQALGCGGNPLMHGLMTVLLPDGLTDQSSQLALSYFAFMEYHAADNDPVNCIHLRQAPVNLLLEDPIGDIILHAVRISYLFTDALQRVHGNGISAAAIRTVGTVTEADVPGRCVAFTGSLEAFTLLPERPHDIAEFFVCQGRPGWIAGQVVGLLRTWICLV